jgi:hypothetical protein
MASACEICPRSLLDVALRHGNLREQAVVAEGGIGALGPARGDLTLAPHALPAPDHPGQTGTQAFSERHAKVPFHDDALVFEMHPTRSTPCTVQANVPHDLGRDARRPGAYATGRRREGAMCPAPTYPARQSMAPGKVSSSPANFGARDFVDTVVPQTAIFSYWTGDRYPNDE